MKTQLIKVLFSMLIITAFGIEVKAQAHAKKKADEQTDAFRYELEVEGTGVQGTYLIKVWSYSKRPAVAVEQAKKNAVHGVIFKGFPGKRGIAGKSPLAGSTSLEQEKQEFFDQFFADGGKYMKFVSLTTDGAIAANDRLKVGKEYKIGVLVSVNVSLLRKDLEDAGIIRSLNSGF